MNDPLSNEDAERSAREAAFLNDFVVLCNQHRILIGGCGCCGSPFLVDMKKLHEEHVKLQFQATLESLKDSL